MRKRKKTKWFRTLTGRDFQTSTMTAMAYIEAGLVPPAGPTPWCAPHVSPSADINSGDELPPCTFPRSARRKFRKEWRRALDAMEKHGDIKHRTAKKYRAMGPSEKTDTLIPTHEARVARRAIVLDSMIRRGEQILTRSEQSLSGGVESESDADQETHPA